MKTYIALIGDLIGSKKIENREKLQQEIKGTFQTLNSKFEEIIVSKLMLTLGDEFQAILKPDKKVVQLIDQLQLQIEYPFRMGLGYGMISTKIDPEFSIGADGPAFWHARNAVEEVYIQNWNGRCNILFKGSNLKQDEIINTLFLNSEILKSLWTDKQSATFQTIINQGIYQEDFIQKDIAELMGISESSLSKRLTLGNIKIYLHTKNLLGRLLEDYHELAE